MCTLSYDWWKVEVFFFPIDQLEPQGAHFTLKIKSEGIAEKDERVCFI